MSKINFREIYYFLVMPNFLILIKKIINILRKTKKIYLNNSERKSILVVKIDEIGDFILSTPFLREIRNVFEQAEILLIVNENTLNIAELCPYVNIVIPFNKKFNKVIRVFQQYYRTFIIGKKFLWNRNIDLALIPRWDNDDSISIFIAIFSRAKEIAGFIHSEKYNFLLDIGLDKKRIQHEVLQNLEFIKIFNKNPINVGLEIWIDSRDELVAKQILKTQNKEIKVVIVAPGASKLKKQWLIEKYCELIKKLLDHKVKNFFIILLGSPSEYKLGRYLQNISKINLVNMIGKTTLRQASAIIKCSDVFVGNDSGLMHIAASLEVPVVSIFCHPVNGDNSFHNSPTRFGPWTKIKIILQPLNAKTPCVDKCISNTSHCINQVKVDDVYTSIMKILKMYNSQLIL